MAILSPYPWRDDVLDRARALLSKSWQSWFLDLWRAVNNRVDVLTWLDLPAQASAVATTAFPNTPLATPGLYRVAATIVPAAISIGGSLSVSTVWRQGGADKTMGVAVASGTSGLPVSGAVLIHIDEGSALRYSIAYVAGGSALTAAVTVSVERLR